MHNIARSAAVAAATALALAAGGCFKKSAAPEKPPAAPPAPLCVELIGDPRLQWYQGGAHSLYVRIFPLSSDEGFASDAKSAKADALLADPPPLLPGSAGTPRSQVVYPGKTGRIEFETGGKEVAALGVAAGYFDAKKDTKLLVRTAGNPPGGCIPILFGEAGIEGVVHPPAPGGR